MNKIKICELFHIWKTQPCEAGDTLGGGEVVATLQRNNLIESTENGYMVTTKGWLVLEQCWNWLDKYGVYVGSDGKILVNTTGFEMEELIKNYI